MGIVHVVVDGLLDLLLALRRVDGLGSALRDVTGAIELRALTTEPQLVQWDALALEGGNADILWYDGVTTANTRETCRL